MTHWTESAGTWRRSDGVEIEYAPTYRMARWWRPCQHYIEPGPSGERFARKRLLRTPGGDYRKFKTQAAAMSAADREWPIGGGKE